VEENIEVRLANPSDMDELMKLGFMACEDNGFVDYSPRLLAQEIWPSLHLDHGLLGVIGPPQGEIQGFVLLRIGTMFYSERLCLEEKCLWVHPNYRSAKGGRAKRLLDFTKKTADTLKIPLIIGIMSTKRAAGKTALYRREFGEPSGAFFLYGAECGMAKLAEEVA
jgi:N-acetylglutamate synthase-like GNAT family acetyltransferase